MTSVYSSRPVALWLFACCVCIALMVLIGGLTRLTGSGLSITSWKPVTGILPPMSDTTWQEEFDSYRQSPEYKHINRGMDLDGFKGIFWLEFIHRLLGRITGFVFLLPLLYFAFKKRIDPPLGLKLGGIFLLGGLQGVIGWYMVSSGLKDVPYVSQYWLAFHLTAAFVIYALIFLLGLSLYTGAGANHAVPGFLRRYAFSITVLILMQVILGAFVAGLDAGLMYNTFPDMDGHIIPPDMFFLTPWYRNFFANVTTVQFNHRLMAYIVTVAIVGFWLISSKFQLTKSLKTAIAVLFFVTMMQMTLGIATLLHKVPVGLASMHQMGALALFTVSLCVSYWLRRR